MSKALRSGPVSLRVVTYNLLAQSGISSSLHPDTVGDLLDPVCRTRMIIDQIIALEGDILCLQEVDALVFGDLCADLRGMGYGQSDLQMRRGKSYGNAMFLRDPFNRCAFEALWVSHDASGAGSSTRPVQVAEIQLEGRRNPITAANMHLSLDDPARPEEWRGWYQGHSVLDRLSESDGPKIVCGDFNAEPNSELLKAFYRAKLRDTHPADVMSCNIDGHVKRVDHILVSEHLVASALSVPEVSESPRPPCGDMPSDHVPVVTAVTLP